MSASQTGSAPEVRIREIHGFTLSEARYLPGYRGGEHRHLTPYFGYVVSGEFVERTHRGDHRHSGGTLHFHPAGDPHSGEVGSAGARCFSILPGERFAARLESRAGLPLYERASPLLSALAARCHRGFLSADAASDLECEASALELIAAVLRLRTPRESRVPGWLHGVRDYLHEQREGSVRLDQLALIAQVHPAHLSRVFRQTLGVTPAGYLRRLRLEQACAALANTDQPLVDIAFAAGYSSQSHLTRAFREHFGLTPAVYRRSRRRPSG